MQENLLKEKEILLEQIKKDRDELLDLNSNKNEESFVKVFIKPLLVSFLIVALGFRRLDDNRMVAVFIFTFIVSAFFFFLQARRKKEKIDSINQEKKIRLQADIFTKSKKLADLEEKLKKEN